MICSQFGEQRLFAGRLDAGQDIVAGLKTICIENRINFGWISAFAALERPEVIFFGQKAPEEPKVLEGTVFCPALTGNISLLDDETDVRLYAYIPGKDGGSSSGRILSGAVVVCEFLLIALDDVVFVRDGLDKAFQPWVQVFTPEALKARSQPLPPMQPIVRPPQQQVISNTPAEEEELYLLEMQPGDYVDHPKFGRCPLIGPPTDDKLTIRLPSGKKADLHLGALRVLAPIQQGKVKVFPLEVRRKS